MICTNSTFAQTNVTLTFSDSIANRYDTVFIKRDSIVTDTLILRKTDLHLIDSLSASMRSGAPQFDTLVVRKGNSHVDLLLNLLKKMTRNYAQVSSDSILLIATDTVRIIPRNNPNVISREDLKIRPINWHSRSKIDFDGTRAWAFIKKLPKRQFPEWKITSKPSLTLTQSAFSHWVAGGANSIAGVAAWSEKIVYKENNFTFESAFEAAYGLASYDSHTEKNNDKLELSAKFGLKSSEKWYYSMLFQFKTQFDKGFSSYPIEDHNNYVSRFMAPGYLTSSIGWDYKPTSELSFVLAPLSSKFTFVCDKRLSDKGAYGVKEGKRSYSEVGSLIKASYSKTTKNKSVFKSYIEMFSNWFDNPQNVDFTWEVDFDIKINKWFSTKFYTKLIYDDNVDFTDSDGNKLGPQLQVKQILGVGLSVSF